MHYTIEKLMHSKEPVQQYFIAAQQKWAEILADIDSISTANLAETLSSQQDWFESNCGGRLPGQEIMAWSAFGYFYSTHSGYGDNEAKVKKLAEAFQSSTCSSEVLGHAEDAVKLYYVNET
jgi:hypothetical protein